MTNDRRIYLSIDADYFSRELPEFDWSHSEHSGLYRELAWHTRVAWHEETRIDKFANPKPAEFFDKLVSLGFEFDCCSSLNVSDSHLYAAPDFIDTLRVSPDETIEIINFDAHHDMGYGPWPEMREQWVKLSRVDCSNWLLVLLCQQKRLRATVVYPEWKGLEELQNTCLPWKRLRSVRRRAQHLVYSDESVRSLAGPVAGVFIARSSAWLPPWQDHEFVKLVRAAEKATGLASLAPYVDREKCDPREPRLFNLQAALAHQRDVHAMIASMRDQLVATKTTITDDDNIIAVDD